MSPSSSNDVGSFDYFKPKTLAIFPGDSQSNLSSSVSSDTFAYSSNGSDIQNHANTESFQTSESSKPLADFINLLMVFDAAFHETRVDSTKPIVMKPDKRHTSSHTPAPSQRSAEP